MLPRPATSLEPSVSYPLPSPSSWETSTASGSTASSSVWESSQSTVTPYGLQQQVGVGPGAMGSPVHGQYAGPVYPGGARHEPPVFGPSPASMFNDARHDVVTSPTMSMDGRQAVSYHYSMPHYRDPAARSYGGPSGGGC